jgi:hypothetical protein
MKISIPKPCHENWNEMLPEEQGRFCLKCSKTVIDFSKKSKDEITAFFKEASGKICGKFTIHQIEKPKSFSILNKRIAKFAVALYFVFGGFLFTSCSENKGTLGEPKVEHIIEKNQKESVHKILGELSSTDTLKSITQKKNIVLKHKTVELEMKLGEVEITQEPHFETLKGAVVIEQ